jgi:hypothetical protein
MLGLTACDPIHTREDFRRDVMSKSPKEVEKHLGKPDSIDNSDPAKLTWIYDNLTIDTENKNKRDPKTRIVFGRQDPAGSPTVAEVHFGS